MKPFPSIAAATLLAAAAAEAVGVGQIPAPSTIAAHVDFDQAKRLPACSAAVNWLFSNVLFLRQESLVLSRSFGLKVPEDLSDLLLFSDGIAADARGAVNAKAASSYVAAAFDRPRLERAVRGAKGFRSVAYGSREILSADFAPGISLCFPEDGVVMLSSSASAAKAALAVLDGKAPAVAATSPIAAELGSSAPMTVVALGGGGSPNLSVITGGFIRADADLLVARVTEAAPGTATLSVEMTFAAPETALQVAGTLNGLKLLCSLKRDGGVPEGLVQSFLAAKVGCEGRKVTFSMGVKAADIAKLKA